MNTQIRYYFNPPNAKESYPGANYSNYIYLSQVSLSSGYSQNIYLLVWIKKIL